MDSNAIKNFCVWARQELTAEVKRRCALYDISQKPEAPHGATTVAGRVLTAAEARQRDRLLEDVREHGLDHLVERAAYTWFNRLMAIRYMEVNGLLPSRVRILSSVDGSSRPDALRAALSLNIDGLDVERVTALVEAGDDEALFREVFLAQCAELVMAMPDVFEPIGAALELLLPDGLLRPNGVAARMVSEIPEEDWTRGVEIVGWMYQFYVSERKKQATDAKKVTADLLAPATQLFTPDYIVKFLLQNSLGRLWMLNRPQSRLAEHMEYYLAPEEGQEGEFRRVGSPEEITLVDPCCGSGHILVYAFDLLAAMYEECGFARRDIPSLILEKNLTGLEIDPRAAAMASFCLTMKGCELDRRFLRRRVRPNVVCLQPVRFTAEERELIAQTGAAELLEVTKLLDALAHLDECGSLLRPTKEQVELLHDGALYLRETDSVFGESARTKLDKAAEELEPLACVYSVCCTNPPYLGSKSFDAWLGTWVKKNYPDSARDLFAAFMSRDVLLTERLGYCSMVTMQSWMFLGSYEKLRKGLLKRCSIVAMAHLGSRAFGAISGEVVQTTAFVLKNGTSKVPGVYLRVVDEDGEEKKCKALVRGVADADSGCRYCVGIDVFSSIPGNPISYWVTPKMFRALTENPLLGSLSPTKQGLATADNDRFLRFWWELSRRSVFCEAHSPQEAEKSGAKWFPCDKGGEFRKWYGNLEYVVNWQNDGEEIRSFTDARTGKLRSRPVNTDLYFQPYVAWSDVSSGTPSFRDRDHGLVIEHTANFVPAEGIESGARLSLLGLMNTSVARALLIALAPTLHFGVGQVNSFPIAEGALSNVQSRELVRQNVEISRADWDAFETSRDFRRHPLLPPFGEHALLGDAYAKWEQTQQQRFDSMRANEEELNRLFAGIYDMEDEVPIDVPTDRVSVRRADLGRDVRSLISYAMGCIMGRYSLDKDGLILADQGDGLEQYLAQVPCPTFMPDANGIVPITDEEYFHDDATGLFVDWVKCAFGGEGLEENLTFIAEALGTSGAPRQVIREYFAKEFFADHCDAYSMPRDGKRPIYWLFSSGKEGGFRALVYMHRYTPDLLARLRTDYVHQQQERYRTQIALAEDALKDAKGAEKARLNSRKTKLEKQLAETVKFEEKLHHLADQMIEIDLDDGFKHNYAIFKDVVAKV